MSIKQDYLEAMHEQDQNQEEYETRVFVFQTDFKNNHYISKFVNGFSNQKFVGTQKEYDDATAIYWQSHDYGKIIGSHKFTLEEWEAKS